MLAAWDRRPDMAAWYAELLTAASSWMPDVTLVADRDRILSAILRATEVGSPWLLHPCMNRLTSARSDTRLERDIRLITWVAAHSQESLGTMSIQKPTWRWTLGGSAAAVPPGRHDLQELVASDAIAGDQNIHLDPFCRSTGFPLLGCWSENPSAEQESLIGMITRETNHGVALLTRFLPGCAAWVTAVTTIVVPTLSREEPSSSGSYADIPGLIHVSAWNGPVAVLEGLVHESAHHHFTICESAGHLVDPEHLEFYSSPLRPEPRPLRNIFLAFHALWHMVSFYNDALKFGMLGPEWSSRRDLLTIRLEQGLANLEAGQAFITPRAWQLLETLSGDEISQATNAGLRV